MQPVFMTSMLVLVYLCGVAIILGAFGKFGSTRGPRVQALVVIFWPPVLAAFWVYKLAMWLYTLVKAMIKNEW